MPATFFELQILYLNKYIINYNSSLPDTAAESGGKYTKAYHLIGKNHVEQYIRTLGIPNTTFVYVSLYFRNIGDGAFSPFVQKENGEVELVFPYLEENDTVPMIDAESDTGVRV